MQRCEELAKLTLNTIEFDVVDTMVLVTRHLVAVCLKALIVATTWNMFVAGKRGIQGVGKMHISRGIILAIVLTYIL